MKTLVNAGAMSLVVVSMLLTAFLMFKVPPYGVYKLAATTFMAFKKIWVALFMVIAVCSYYDASRKKA